MADSIFLNGFIVERTNDLCRVALIVAFEENKIISIEQAGPRLVDILRVVRDPAVLGLSENLIMSQYGG